MPLELALINSDFSWREAKYKFRAHAEIIGRSRNLENKCLEFVKKWHLVTYTKAGVPRIHGNAQMVIRQQIELRQRLKFSVSKLLQEIDAFRLHDECTLESCGGKTCRFSRFSLEKWTIYEYLMFFVTNILKHHLPDSTWKFLKRYFSSLVHVEKTRLYEKENFLFVDPFIEESRSVNWEASTVRLSVCTAPKESSSPSLNNRQFFR